MALSYIIVTNLVNICDKIYTQSINLFLKVNL